MDIERIRNRRMESELGYNAEYCDAPGVQYHRPADAPEPEPVPLEDLIDGFILDGGEVVERGDPRFNELVEATDGD